MGEGYAAAGELLCGEGLNTAFEVLRDKEELSRRVKRAAAACGLVGEARRDWVGSWTAGFEPALHEAVNCHWDKLDPADETLNTEVREAMETLIAERESGFEDFRQSFHFEDYLYTPDSNGHKGAERLQFMRDHVIEHAAIEARQKDMDADRWRLFAHCAWDADWIFFRTIVAGLEEALKPETLDPRLAADSIAVLDQWRDAMVEHVEDTRRSQAMISESQREWVISICRKARERRQDMLVQQGIATAEAIIADNDVMGVFRWFLSARQDVERTAAVSLPANVIQPVQAQRQRLERHLREHQDELDLYDERWTPIERETLEMWLICGSDCSPDFERPCRQSEQANRARQSKRTKARNLTHLAKQARDFIERNGARANENVWDAFVQSLRPADLKRPFAEGIDYPTYRQFRSWWTKS